MAARRVPPGIAPLFWVYLAGTVGVLLSLTVSGAARGAWVDVTWDAVVFWGLMCGLANLLAAPAGAHTYLSMSAPVNIAIAALFPPSTAAVIVVLSSVSQLEVQRRTTLSRALFNRTQIGLCTAGAAAVLTSRAGLQVPEIVAAVVVYHSTNWLLVAGAEHLARGTPFFRVVRGFLPQGPLAAATYLSLGAIGVALSLVYNEVGAWAVALLLLPLAGARQAVRATEDIQQAERERRALADRLVEEREGERLRIASDLHDTVLQALAAVQVQADNVRVALDRGDPRAEGLAVAVRDGVDGSIADVRRVIGNLRGTGIDPAGVAATFRRYADAFSRHSGCQTEVRVDGPVESLPLPLSLLLLESCQEALTNVARHAAASTVLVEVTVEQGQVQLRVQDDGRGFNAADQRDGYGLSLTRQRLALLGGGCWVESSPGLGTRILARLPLPKGETRVG